MTRTTDFVRTFDTFVSVVSCSLTADLEQCLTDGLRWWDREFPGQHANTRDNMLPIKANTTGSGDPTHHLCFIPAMDWAAADNYVETIAEWRVPVHVEFGHLSTYLKRHQLVLLNPDDEKWYQDREATNRQRLRDERRNGAMQLQRDKQSKGQQRRAFDIEHRRRAALNREGPS